MTKARRSFLSDLMALAWDLYRTDLRGPDPRTFADALKGAWKWTKGAAARRASAPAWTKGGLRVEFRSMVQSPMRRATAGQPYAFDRLYRAGRLTSRLGA